LLVLSGVAALLAARAGGPDDPQATGPNIVLVVTDDQRWDTLDVMPTVRRALVGRGVTFENGFVVNPLCCPSRASILTGLHSHSTGVYNNGGPFGGFRSFRDDSTLATWLDDAGYETALIGKYLNRYGGTYVPPGWDRWVAFSGRPRPRPSAYYDYVLNVDGELRPYGDAPAQYSTDVLAREAVSFIREASGPFFLYFAPSAPHGPATPAPRHADAFAGLQPWRPPAHNERDVTDKPAWLAALPPLTKGEQEELDSLRLAQLRSLLAVDEAVRAILSALAETNRLVDTLIVFTSDNGQAWGEHRWDKKMVPYEEVIRVPLVVRYDQVVDVARGDDHLVANIDIAPTLASAAGISAAESVWDGRSLLPLLVGRTSSWRRELLLEHLRAEAEHVTIPTYCGLRTERYTYVTWETGEEELYDLRVDPHELRNVSGAPRTRDLVPRLRARLSRACEPPPPGLAPSGLKSASDPR
jgi:N-acetylglucosamine-6-sulfatase